MRAIFVVLVILFPALTASARADSITVGIFAPSAPFSSTAARVELANRLGDHLGNALGKSGMGRVYARAGDFAAAVKRGEVTVALVDATYLAGSGGYTVLAASLRGGETSQGWMVIARTATRFTDLAGKRVLVPANGGHETDFVLNVLLGGVDRGFFKVEAAPDTASALAAIGLGKADAAVVPAGVDVPAGARKVLALPAVSTPMLVAYGNLSAQQRTAIGEAATRFKGDATIGGFRAGSAEGVRAIARRFSAPIKRGPLVVPAARLLVGDLVEARRFAIERTPANAFAAGRAAK